MKHVHQIMISVCLTFGATLYASPITEACLHASGGAQSKETWVKQTNQTALILFDGARQELILSADYYSADPLKSIAWILPIPALPTRYETASTELFPALNKWARLKRKPRLLRAKGKGRPTVKSSRRRRPLIRLAEPAQVGPYQIQPIQASGVEALTTLNKWMESNGFAALPEEGLKYYLERSWTFLAIKVDPSKDVETLSSKGGLQPLRVSFPSERVIFPLKFSTHMGEFSARIYVLSSVKFERDDFDGARDRGFEIVHKGRYYGTARFSREHLGATSHVYIVALPQPLRSLVAEFFIDRVPTLSVLYNERVNTSKTPWGYGQRDTALFKPADWSEELSIPGLAAGQKLMGTVEVTQ